MKKIIIFIISLIILTSCWTKIQEEPKKYNEVNQINRINDDWIEQYLCAIFVLNINWSNIENTYIDFYCNKWTITLEQDINKQVIIKLNKLLPQWY